MRIVKFKYLTVGAVVVVVVATTVCLLSCKTVNWIRVKLCTHISIRGVGSCYKMRHIQQSYLINVLLMLLEIVILVISYLYVDTVALMNE